MNKYDTLNKAILYTVNRYMESAQGDGLELTPLHGRLKFLTKGYMVMNPLEDKDMKIISEIASNEDFRELLSKKISFLVFTLELMKLWAESVPKEYRPFLNMSDKKIKTGRAMYAISMLKLKQKDTDKHKELTEVIEDSIETAKSFFGFHRDMIIEEVA